MRRAETIAPAVLIAALYFAGTLAAKPVMVAGTGDPNIDVPAVQAAVDRGGRVVLKGHFSFDRPPTTPDGGTYSRMVTVSKSVVISGITDANGEMATIEGGNRPFLVDGGDAHVTIQRLHFVRRRDARGDLPTIVGGEWPFLVDAVDAHVTIEGLRFVRPRAGAIWVYAVGGLAITGCRVESIEATAECAMQAGQANPVSGAIFVGSDTHPGAAAQPLLWRAPTQFVSLFCCATSLIK